MQSRDQYLADYIDIIGDREKALNMLVGDTQRIWVYANAGFAEPQPIDERTQEAYVRLVNAGYTSRLTDERARD